MSLCTGRWHEPVRAGGRAGSQLVCGAIAAARKRDMVGACCCMRCTPRRPKQHRQLTSTRRCSFALAAGPAGAVQLAGVGS
eukprot:62958-Chlamydomonas_euryale.AAC.7